MSERSSHTNSADIRGGYSDIYNSVGIRMYQLPPKIVEALRRNGPSVLEGASAYGSSDAAPVVVSEPIVRDAEPAVAVSGPEPVVDMASADAPAKKAPVAGNTESVVVPTAHEPAREAVAFSGERYRPLPYRVMQSLAKSSFNRIELTHKKTSSVRSTEPSVEPASVADIDNGAIVNVENTSAKANSQERYRPLPYRVIKGLGEKATFRSIGVKETLKSIWKQERKLPKMAFAIGAVSVAAVFAGEKAMAIEENIDGNRIFNTSAGDVYNPVSQMPIKSYAMGGNTQVVGPIQEVDMKGYAPGNRDEALVWRADMGIGNGGSSEQSIEEGSAVSMAKYRESQARGEHAHFSYYSFGTYAGQDFAWDVYRQNGNKWPDDLTIDLIGGAQTAESIGKSPFGKVGMGLIGLRNGEDDRAIPPGAKVRMFYNDRDPYASGGNESGLSLLYSIAGLGHGTHEVPDRNDPNVTWTMYKDANGIEHWVAHRKNEWVIDAIERAGIKVMDTHSANEAIRALFPRNDDPNAPPPEADVRKALTLGARALDRQIDPSGNTKIFESIVENMPEPWKALMNDSWNGINHVADAVARAMADPSPQNIKAAFDTVMQEASKFMGGLQQVMGNPSVDIKNFTVGSVGEIVRDTTRQYMGHEIDIEPQLNQLADTLLASAKAYAADMAAKAQAQAQAQASQNSGQQGDPLTIVSQLPDQLPQNNPLITVNTAPNATAPEIAQGQAPAPVVEVTVPESSRIGMLPDAPAVQINIPSVVQGQAPAPMPAPTTSAEITSPSAPVVGDTPAVSNAPEWVPPAPDPEPVWTPPKMPEPVYQAPEPVWTPPAEPVWTPPPAPAPAPPVFEAPAPPPPPPPAPVFVAPPPPPPAPVFQMPSFDLGNIFGGSAPSAPAFSPSPITSIPNLNEGMILEPAS